jgi:NADH-quinone oxidoreductase subunit B
MIVAGRHRGRWSPALRRIYDQMPEPKWVISMGACASIGGVFDNYAIVQVSIRSCPSTQSPAVRLVPNRSSTASVELQRKIAQQRLAS